MDFRDKVCLVTGASSGIGRATCLEIAKRGGRLALVARRRELLEELAKEIEGQGAEAAVLPADIGVGDQARAVVRSAHERWGRLDVAIANAGVGILRFATNLTPEQVDQMVNVNFLGTVHVLLESLRLMQAAGGGHLVGVSSLGSLRGLPRSAVYSATKSALNTFLESVRIENGHRGIRVTCAQPGFVDTPMTLGSKQPMPFLLSPEAAARHLVRAIEREWAVARFPWQLSAIVRLSQWIPDRLYDSLLRSTLPK